MFSLFKSRDPFNKKTNVDYADTIARNSAEAAVRSAKNLDSRLSGLDEKDKARQLVSKSYSDAAFEYWVFQLHIISKCLVRNMQENNDSGREKFVDPVFSHIYLKSKAYFEVLHRFLGDAKHTDFNDDFDSVAQMKIATLGRLPLISTDKVQKSFSLKSSALDLTLHNALEDLGFEAEPGYQFELYLIVSETKAVIGYLKIYEEVFSQMRKNMN